MAQLRGHEEAHHRSVANTDPGAHQHRRPRQLWREVRTGPHGSGSQADRRHGVEVQGAHRRRQERALFRSGMGAVCARRGSRQDREHPGHGRFRQRPRTDDRRAVHEDLPSGRHLHAHVRRQPRRAGSRRRWDRVRRSSRRARRASSSTWVTAAAASAGGWRCR